MKTAEIKKVEKISNPLISDDHFLQIKVISIYANYKVEYFLMLRNIVFMQKKFAYCLCSSYICSELLTLKQRQMKTTEITLLKKV